MSTPPRATTAPTRNETPSPLMNADLAIDDSVYDDLRQYYKEGELVEIGTEPRARCGDRRACRHVARDRRPLGRHSQQRRRNPGSLGSASAHRFMSRPQRKGHLGPCTAHPAVDSELGEDDPAGPEVHQRFLRPATACAGGRGSRARRPPAKTDRVWNKMTSAAPTRLALAGIGTILGGIPPAPAVRVKLVLESVHPSHPWSSP